MIFAFMIKIFSDFQTIPVLDLMVLKMVPVTQRKFSFNSITDYDFKIFVQHVKWNSLIFCSKNLYF